MDVKFTETNGKASREFEIRQSVAPGRLHSAWLYSDQKQLDVVFCSAFRSLLSPLDWADGLQVTRATGYNITAWNTKLRPSLFWLLCCLAVLLISNSVLSPDFHLGFGLCCSGGGSCPSQRKLAKNPHGFHVSQRRLTCNQIGLFYTYPCQMPEKLPINTDLSYKNLKWLFLPWPSLLPAVGGGPLGVLMRGTSWQCAGCSAARLGWQAVRQPAEGNCQLSPAALISSLEATAWQQIFSTGLPPKLYS